MKRSIIFIALAFGYPTALAMEALIQQKDPKSLTAALFETLLDQENVSEEHISTLINQGAQVNEYLCVTILNEPLFLTPLHIAAINGHTEACTVLLNNKADPTAKARLDDNEHKNDKITYLHLPGSEISYGTPFYYACNRKKESVIHLLLEHGYKPEDDLLDCLRNAINNESINRLLIKHGIPPLYQHYVSGKIETQLNKLFFLLRNETVSYEEAAALIDEETPFYSRKILDKEESKKFNEMKLLSPLLQAAIKGHTEACRALLQHKDTIQCHPSIIQNCLTTSLSLACLNGHFEIAKILVENDAPINKMIEMLLITEDNDTGAIYLTNPLRGALLENNTNIIKFLLSHDAAVFSDLLYAIKYGVTEGAKTLIEHSNLNTDELNKALIKSIRHNRPSLCDLLISREANPNAGSSSYDNTMLLELAILKGYHEVCRILLQHGADPNAGLSSDNNIMLLELAVRKGYHEVCRVLLQYGADITAGDGIALTLAAESVNLKLVKTLIFNARFEPNPNDVREDLYKALYKLETLFLDKKTKKPFPKDLRKKLLTYLPEAKEAICHFTLGCLKAKKPICADFIATTLEGYISLWFSEIANLQKQIDLHHPHAPYNPIIKNFLDEGNLRNELQNSEPFRNSMVSMCRELFTGYGSELKLEDEAILECIDAALQSKPKDKSALNKEPSTSNDYTSLKYYYEELKKVDLGGVILLGALSGTLIMMVVAVKKSTKQTAQAYNNLCTLIDQENPSLEEIEKLLDDYPLYIYISSPYAVALPNGDTIFLRVLKNGHTDIYKMFIERGYTPPKDALLYMLENAY